MKPENIHDIEILLVQKSGHPVPEFGKPFTAYTTHLDKLLAELEQQGVIKQPYSKKDGAKLKKRVIVGAGLNEFCIEFYIVTPATWGIQNLIRTGNSWFSHRCVTNKNVLAWNRETGAKMSGFLPNDLRYIKGKDIESGESCIKRGDEILSLPTEQDVFNLIFGKWIEPKDRASYAEKMR
jgi:DNA polymerase/3'-5' exonuclease PolX